MEAGIPKCGVMEFLPTGHSEEVLTEQHPLRTQLSLGGHLVPLVTEYKYLGLLVTPDLNLDTMGKHQLAKAKKTLRVLTPFLRCPVLPMAARLQIVKGVLLPRLLFGTEIFGTTLTRTAPMQTVINKALRAVVGCPKKFYAPVWASGTKCVYPHSVHLLQATEPEPTLKAYLSKHFSKM